MDSASILGLVIFSATAAFTPGPNNVMLTSSGATFGFRRSIPHILGIAAGIGCLSVAGGFGLAGLLAAVPQLHLLMKGVAILFLGYLAWKSAPQAVPPVTGRHIPSPSFRLPASSWSIPRA